MRLTNNSNKTLRWTKTSPDEVYERLKLYEDAEARGELFNKAQVNILLKKSIEMLGQEMQKDLTYPLNIMKVFIQTLKEYEPGESISYKKIEEVYQKFVKEQGVKR